MHSALLAGSPLAAVYHSLPQSSSKTYRKHRKQQSLHMHRTLLHLIPRWLGGRQALAREGGLPHPSSTLSFQSSIGWSQYRSPSLLHYKATLSLSPGHSLFKCLHTLFSRAAALAPPSSKCSPRPSLRGYPAILLSTLPCLSKHRSTLPSSCDICQNKKNM